MPAERQAIIELVDNTTERMRRLVFDLRPTDLEDLGLVAAIQRKISYFKRETQLECRLIVEPENLKVSAPLDLAIFRIVQESLCNVIKHSKATSVTIMLRKLSGRNLILEIVDDGRGISPREVKSLGTLGISSMQTRVSLLGGRLKIVGTRGKRTQIRATFPLNINTKRAKK
jgi:two-component system, NarL family, sensor histidine kinase DegS